jgi:putative phosphoesterase
MQITEPLKRIAVLGDIHGDSVRLSAALDFINTLTGIDGILCVGDVVNLDANTEDCCRLLTDNTVAAVCGNHDRWFLQNLAAYLAEDHHPNEISLRSRAYIAGLPSNRIFETVTGPLLLCHGLLEDDMAGIYPEGHFCSPGVHLRLSLLAESREVNWMIAGHTHRRMFRTFDALRLINPGTICFDKDSGFCTVDFENGRVQFYDIDSELIVAPGAELG